jgi:multiple sugar transport system permease protein
MSPNNLLKKEERLMGFYSRVKDKINFLKTERAKEVATGYLLLFPFLLIISTLIIFPIIYSFRISFMDFSYLDLAGSRYIFFDNYRELFQDKTFLTSLKNTLKLLVLVVPLQTTISLILANILNLKLKLKGFYRAVFFIPYITSPVAVGAIMVYLFNKGGLFTKFLTNFGLDNVAWYADSRYAFYLIVGIIVWTQIGFYSVIYLSALQNISMNIYEAAWIDGATKSQIFFNITIPLLKPTTFLVLVMGGIATLQIFDQPYIISTTGQALPGSPGDTTLTMVMYLYTQAFRYFKMGYASAAAFIIFLMIFLITIIQYLFFGESFGKVGGNQR